MTEAFIVSKNKRGHREIKIDRHTDSTTQVKITLLRTEKHTKREPKGEVLEREK